MKGRFFLDTNLFVFSFDRNAPAKSKRGRDLIAEASAKNLSASPRVA
jgi:hypothetical protein